MYKQVTSQVGQSSNEVYSMHVLAGHFSTFGGPQGDPVDRFHCTRVPSDNNYSNFQAPDHEAVLLIALLWLLQPLIIINH